MAKKNKFYTVWKGRTPGIYDNWETCEAQVKGFEGARYRSFPSREEAEKALTAPEDYCRTDVKPQPVRRQTTARPPLFPALCVDAACSGNPGVMEYRGVYLLDIHQDGTKETTELFRRGTFPNATNNIGEFLALVHGLSLLQQQGNDTLPVYSDSRTALAWLKAKQVKTKLTCSPDNILLFDLIRRAEQWLHTHIYKNKVLKWETEHWGEIPADFGRK